LTGTFAGRVTRWERKSTNRNVVAEAGVTQVLVNFVPLAVQHPGNR
jgi:hypothetical protein